MQSYLSGTPIIYTIDFTSPLNNLVSAPTTEVATFWLPAAAPSAQTSSFNTAFSGLKSAVQQAAGEVYVITGAVRGLVANPSGVKTAAYVALVGWQSVDAHNAFTQTTPFANAIGALEPYVSGLTDHNDHLITL
jgi:hypothetical protein